MNNDLISREALKQAIEKHRPMSAIKSLFLDGLNSMFMDCIIEINNAPTVPYEERPQGEWVKIVNKISERETETHWECSECHNPDFRLGESEFCSFCGASMKGGAE